MHAAKTAAPASPQDITCLLGNLLAKMAIITIAADMPSVPADTAMLALVGSRPKLSASTGTIG